jgi:hypothetical protein
MSAIAEAYIHFNYRDLSDKEFNAYTEQISHLVSEIARGYYGKGSKLELEIDDQSFLTKAVLIAEIMSAVIGTAYGAMAIYPNVRQGVIQACEDSERFGMDVCDAVMKTLNVGPEDKIYRRTRPKELNSLVRIVGNIDKALDASDISPEKEKIIISEIGKDINRLQNYGVPTNDLDKLVSFIPNDAFPSVNITTKSLISSVSNVGKKRGIQAPYSADGSVVSSRHVRRRGHRYHKKIIL